MSMQQVPAPTGQITGQVQFYSRPEPLSVETHGKLGVNPLSAPYAFAAAASVVPLQVGEFGMAALSFPIIFAGERKTPMAVMGLRAGENLFVRPDGQLEDFAYLPGFIRRYPFVLAGDEGQDQLVVCIDRDAPMVAEGAQIPLFQNGQLTPYAQNAVQFCTDFETERRRTDQFVARLKQLDLFESKSATFTPRNPDGTTGQAIQLADYFAVSEERLAALSDQDLSELHSNNALRQVHAHLISMHNWERLVFRAAQRAPAVGSA